MRGQFGYVLYEVERLKREGKLPADYNVFKGMLVPYTVMLLGVAGVALMAALL